MITIGIPFFNSEKTLEKTIRSVFAQTFRDWELILVDDGSTDRSLEIARSVKDPRVRVVSDGQRRYLAGRLNQIAAEAKYDFVARMDSDDIMFPDRLETQRRLFDDPEIQVVSCYYLAIDEEDNVQDILNTWPYSVEEFTPERIITRRVSLPCHPAVMARKQWFLDNPYDESLPIAQDLELWVRTSSTGRLTRKSLLVRPEPLYFYRPPVMDRGDCSKYIRLEKIGRTIYWKYGPGILGWPGTLYWLLRDWARTRVLSAATYWRVISYYTKYVSRHAKRYGEIDGKAKAEYQRELIKALEAEVPGWDAEAIPPED